jgi:TPR repeat protein
MGLAQQYSNMRLNSVATRLAKRNKFDEAFLLWSQASARGHGKATFNLAVAYEMGRGVPPDLTKVL